ncbi:translation initiation factor IF-2-like isoform X1 [Moschus berezovskii]|uniref:translation initiation factor IF-2-like isoform X1 n=1 Tax=Moschus berezovskii TaxID=68408 RepID=UPI002444A0C0|nr:translation initiation factor IF-2-like isoform X1 [Moschus berezovskii]
MDWRPAGSSEEEPGPEGGAGAGGRGRSRRAEPEPEAGQAAGGRGPGLGQGHGRPVRRCQPGVGGRATKKPPGDKPRHPRPDQGQIPGCLKGVTFNG